MELILKVKDHLYSEPDKNGKQKILKRNIQTKIRINTIDILAMGEVINNKGTVLKNYTKLTCKEAGNIIVNHSFNELIKLTEPNKIGFRYGRNN